MDMQRLNPGKPPSEGAGIKFMKTMMMMLVHRWAPFAETEIVD
jgi:hypothetical protein